MPGLVGCINTQQKHTEEKVNKSREALRYFEWYLDYPIFQDTHIIASRTHLGITDKDTAPAEFNNYAAWVEGEAYNIDELNNIFNLTSNTLQTLLIEAASKNLLNPVLEKLDAYFVAVLYDKEQQQLNLISDRLGLKPLFIWDDGKHFVWCSELKGFLKFNHFQPNILQEAFDCFMDLGHMVGDVTWFKNVTQLSASTVLTVDLKTERRNKTRYWSWSRIKKSTIPFDEAAQVLGELIQESIQSRFHNDERIGIGLSGGLDSRVLLAGTQDSKIPCYTFGQQGALDIKLAIQAAAVNKNPHYPLYFTPKNWFNNRLNSVWQVDGMKSLIHTHYATFHNDIKNILDINLNGLFADVVLGGLLITPKTLNRRINTKTARSFYKNYHELDNIHDSFYDIETVDAYASNNRCRRHVHLGSVDIGTQVVQRNPLVANKLIEFIYSLPDEYRLYSNLYNNALLNQFPQYFETIPWQSTGNPISRTVPKSTILKRKAINTIKSLPGFQDIKSLIYKSGVINRTREYADYENWLRQPDVAAQFSTILKSKDAFYKNFTADDYDDKYLSPHLLGKKNYTEQIGRAITVETWLSQIFESKT